MPAKKTDWKRERKQMQAWLENMPDNNFDPGTVGMQRGNRQSVGNTDGEPPHTREEVMAMLQKGHLRRSHPVISRTMAERMRGLFGGGDGARHPSKRDAWDRLKDRD